LVTGDNETGRKTPPKLAPGTLTPIVFLKDGILLNFADFNKRILKSQL